MKKYYEFDSLKTEKEGVMFFVPNDEEKYRLKKPCKGFGIIKYGEGSIYTGQIKFTGSRYQKLGEGKQDFIRSTIGDPFDDGKGNIIRRNMYVGHFDYRKTDWIYGNGVMYYCDENNKPLQFVKGFYEGTNRVGPYQGDFDYNTLKAGFDKSMENFEGFDEKKLAFNRVSLRSDFTKQYDTLFIGDSYFEFWFNETYASKTFEQSFDTNKYLNIGVGGTTFADWIKYFEVFDQIKTIDRIVINLGFNDIHMGCNSLKTYNNEKLLIEKLKDKYPNAEIYLLNVIHAPLFPEKYNIEKRYNSLIKKNVKGVKIIDSSSVIENAPKGNYFNDDQVHLNKFGYELFFKVINTTINE